MSDLSGLAVTTWLLQLAFARVNLISGNLQPVHAQTLLTAHSVISSYTSCVPRLPGKHPRAGEPDHQDGTASQAEHAAAAEFPDHTVRTPGWVNILQVGAAISAIADK